MDELNVLEKKHNIGLITKIEMLLHFNKDMDEAELNEKLGELAEEKTQEAEATAQPEAQGSLVERLINA